jgi:hypothetical protein
LAAKCPVFIESALRQGASIIPDIFEHRRIKELEKRVADLEHLVGWVTGLLIDFVAVVIAIGAAIFVAGDYRLSAVDGSVVLAFMVTMLALNFIFRKVASWCFRAPPATTNQATIRPLVADRDNHRR